MAGPATNTAYPVEIEAFPEINPNAVQNGPGIEHDVMHDKLHATVNALQGLVGFAAQAPSKSVLERLDAADSTALTVLSIVSGVVTIDLALGGYFTLLLSSNVASVIVTNPPRAGFGKTFTVLVKQDTVGGRTIALPVSFKPTGGSDVGVAAGSNAETMLAATSFNQGARWIYSMQDVTP